MATAGAGPGWNPANDDFSLPTNSKIGSYTIGDKLGEGSFSITYKVSSDASQEAQAVMKVLRGEHGHHQKVFEVEVAHLGLTKHLPPEARVTRLVESFEDDGHGGCFCIVMRPLCEGGDLQELLRHQPLSYSLQDALRWIHQVGETLYLLGSAGEAQMYHGDINPRNILLRREPGSQQLDAYVADFGVSVRTRAFGMMYEDMHMPRYSSSTAPELHEGDRSFDGRAQVWSWATLAFALLDRSDRLIDWDVFDVHDHFLHLAPGALAQSLLAPWPADAPPPAPLLQLLEDCLCERSRRVTMATVVNVMRSLAGGGSLLPWASLSPDPRDVYPVLFEALAVESAEELGAGVPVRLLVMSEALLSQHRRGARALPGDELAGLLAAKSRAHELRGDYGESLEALEAAMQTVSQGTPVAMRFGMLLRLAGLYIMAGQCPEAVAAYQEALGLDVGDLVKTDVRVKLANVYEMMGDLGTTIKELQAVLLELDNAEERAMVLAYLSTLHTQRAEHEAALDTAIQAVQACQGLGGSHVERLANEALQTAGERLGLDGLVADTEAPAATSSSVDELARTVATLQRQVPRGHPRLAIAMAELGFALQRSGEHRAALRQLHLALRTWRERSRHRQAGTMLLGMVVSALALEHYPEAMGYASKALALFREAHGAAASHRDLVQALEAKVVCFRRLGWAQRAASCYREIIDLHDRADPPLHPPRLIEALGGLAVLLQEMSQQSDEALEVCRRGTREARSREPVDYDEVATWHIRTGKLLVERGSPREELMQYLQELQGFVGQLEAELPEEDLTRTRVTYRIMTFLETMQAKLCPQAGGGDQESVGGGGAADP